MKKLFLVLLTMAWGANPAYGQGEAARPRQLIFSYFIVFADMGPWRPGNPPLIDSLLRGALPYTHYVTQGMGTFRLAGENIGTNHIGDFRYRVRFDLKEPVPVRDDAPVRADVSFSQESWPLKGVPSGQEEVLLASKDVNIPLGQTVVLGTKTIDRDNAIILIMRPQLATGRFRSKED